MHVDLVSLYDYLGHPAGRELGAKVFAASKLMGAIVGVKKLQFGRNMPERVITYDKAFLDKFFAVKNIIENKDILKERTFRQPTPNESAQLIQKGVEGELFERPTTDTSKGSYVYSW